MPEELQQIEDWLPIKEISVEAVRKGGLWPGILRSTNCTCGRVASAGCSRAEVAAALLDAGSDRNWFVQVIGSTETVVDERRRMDEIKATGEWTEDSFSNKRAFTHNLTADERDWFHGSLAVADPVVLDVTAGGGGIPFEAGQLGLRSIANELNSVATLILRATCQWPQQYGPAPARRLRASQPRIPGTGARLSGISFREFRNSLELRRINASGTQEPCGIMKTRSITKTSLGRPCLPIQGRDQPGDRYHPPRPNLREGPERRNPACCVTRLSQGPEPKGVKRRKLPPRHLHGGDIAGGQ